MPVPAELIALAHAMAEPSLGASILAEGNVSASTENGTLWIKASGACMSGIDDCGFVEVESAKVLAAMDKPIIDEAKVRELLNDSRTDKETQSVPSTETFMHAYLLTLPGVRFVAHTHPESLLSLLALEDAKNFASKRIFPDEIVLCGAASCWVPYCAPGLPLAIEIKSAIAEFDTKHGASPKTIWLQNHGLIALGKTAKEAESATRMSIKAARITLGALQTGKPVRWLSEAEIQQIANWPDEHYRQRLLWH